MVMIATILAAAVHHPLAKPAGIFHLQPVDYIILGVYVLFILAIGVITGRGHRTSEDFFLSGRGLPAWITGLAFISANLGALEVMGMATFGYEYGMMTAHLYWIGAIPAMVFLGVFMMPFYYGSNARSVPEFLKKRYNEGTRFVNAIFFAAFTPVLSGISMYGMGLVFQDLLGWNFSASVWLSALIVVVYTALGGLTASIYNEVLQFFLIVSGTVPVVIFGLIANHGWGAFVHRLNALKPGLPHGSGHPTGMAAHLTDSPFLHTWANTAGTANPMHVSWQGLVLGLGFVGSFSYWCTNFLVVQRALAAKDLNAAQRTPLIAAFPKMLFPFVVILPGLLALPLLPRLLPPGPHVGPAQNWNNVLPLMMAHYYPAGLLGLGLVALMASFMSGMAGNVTAFNTVFTYDLYGAYIRKNASDRHYLTVGRVATLGGVLLSVAFAYICANMTSIMDYAQVIMGVLNGQLIAVFLMGMFSRRTTPWGGFWGLVVGSVVSLLHWTIRSDWSGPLHVWVSAWRWSGPLCLAHFHSPVAGAFWGMVWAFAFSVAAAYIVSGFTAKKPDSEMVGLVYQLTPKPPADPTMPWWKRPIILGVIALVCTLVLNLLFW